ncbi:DET1- and DDB1-associated protein 1-like [Acyrthosiphon pisum]|uniref:DET1- and DDB1-associated protein 1 domain-containing protein n=1 Tax=Acyrthosiphon pisum TaxID=7029 RepID=A0A8R2JUW1_ACYPI|nr:DET1- and DDB1-associated protein 1-like [Acyrthosiphon pisum]
MSIDEFLDGLPSYNERNFSRFISKSSEKFPAFITTEEPYIPDEQIIVNVCTFYVPLPFSNIQRDRKRRAGLNQLANIENVLE